MRRTISMGIFMVLFCSPVILGQDNQSGVSISLEKLFGRLRNNYNSQEKLAIYDSIRTIIDSYASSDSVFNHSFPNLRYLGQITSPDSLIKIITWNTLPGDGDNKYFCYLIRRSDKTAPVRVYKLSGSYREATIMSDTTYSLSNWYGALYYDIRPFESNNRISYIILGIDYGNSSITRKIIDVLSFNSKNEILFGMKCFNDGKETKFRIVFEFASTAVMSLRFNADSSIVFDHLVPFSPEYKDNRQFYGPDYSYDSYDLDRGVWKFKSNIDIRNKE